MTGAGSLLPLRSRLRELRPAAFGADPTGERMARIRRSPNFADGVFQNPEGARTRPTGSTLEFAKLFFEKEQRVRRAPTGNVPVHPTTLADIAKPSGHRTAAHLDGAFERARRDRRAPGALRPRMGRALFSVPVRRAQAAAPRAGAAGLARTGRRRGHLARPLRPPRPAHDPRAGRNRHGLRGAAGRRRPPGALGRTGRPDPRAGLERVRQGRRNHPHRDPGPPLLRPRPAQPAAHALGVLGGDGARAPDLPQR